jgi:hypothetical protein
LGSLVHPRNLPDGELAGTQVAAGHSGFAGVP